MKSVATYLALSVFACSSSVFVFAVRNKTEVSCYVCMGRDMDSCTLGHTQCPGHCYKVVDTEHDLIAKGCALLTIPNPKEPEILNWAPEPHITLYWTNATWPRGHVHGHTYFCDKDMCNAATRNSLAFRFPVLVISVALMSLMWR